MTMQEGTWRCVQNKLKNGAGKLTWNMRASAGPPKCTKVTVTKHPRRMAGSLGPPNCGGPKLWAHLLENSVSSQFCEETLPQSMAANSWSLGPPSAPAYLACWFGYAWLWSWILFSSSWNKLFYSISICFGNDRNSPIRSEVSLVVVDGLQELVKLIHVA